MAALDLLSLEQFDKLYSDQTPHYEYWFGEAVEKAMPTRLHEFLQAILIRLLYRNGWKAVSGPLRTVLPCTSGSGRHRRSQTDRSSLSQSAVRFLCRDPVARRQSSVHNPKSRSIPGLEHQTVSTIDPNRRKAYLMSPSNPTPCELDEADHFVAGSASEPLFTLREPLPEVEKAIS